MGKESFEERKERNKQLYEEAKKINEELTKELKKRIDGIVSGNYIVTRL